MGKAAGGGERATAATGKVVKRMAAKPKDLATHGSALPVADWAETAVYRRTQTWPSLACISPYR